MLGEYLKQKREERGWSQTDLARHMGLASGQSISNVERGIAPMPVTWVIPLQKTLGVSRRTIIDLLAHEYKLELQGYFS